MSMVARGDLFTVDCETLPGAYLRGSLPGQFATHHYPARSGVKADFAQRGYACRYLDAENQPKIAAMEIQPGELDLGESLKRVSSEHDEVRLRLNEWESFLESMRATPQYLRRVAARELRDRLQFFETGYIDHCRKEEKVIERLRAVAPLNSTRAAQILTDHERFAVDLDRFQRQITSYEQSGDPTVLLTLGGRMIGELRQHIQFEDRLFVLPFSDLAGEHGERPSRLPDAPRQ
jgi:hemerythrin-like domain-containing protein